MLCPVYYIIRPQLLQHTAVPATDDIFVLPIQAGNAEVADCFRIAGALKPANPFCLAVSNPEALDANEATDLIAFFFFPNYHNQNGIPEIMWQHGDLKKLDAENPVTAAAKAQGFPSVTMQPLQSGTERYITAQDPGAIEILRNTYRLLLHDSSDQINKLFVEIESPAAVSTIDKVLQQEEQLFLQQQPALFVSKKKNKELTARLQQAERIAAAAAREISNQAAHMDTLRSGSQATHLQHYYNNEYEVLPLWYKRFGHLIKVVTGKRTFRSLFNGNEKKYKQ